ncbi:MAG: hypothetical protein P8Y42_22580, partial [Exilibacterium sp.]
FFSSSRLQQQDISMDLDTLQAEHPDIAAALINQGVEQGRARERERVGAIVGADEAKGREALAQHLAFATELSADMAVATLKASPLHAPATPTVDQQTGFDQLMRALGNPAIEPDPEEDADELETAAKRIASFSNNGGAV